MEKLIATVGNIKALAKRVHPTSEKAQAIFVTEQVTKAAARLGYDDPEEAASEAMDAHDQSLEEPLGQESDDEPEPIPKPFTPKLITPKRVAKQGKGYSGRK